MIKIYYFSFFSSNIMRTLFWLTMMAFKILAFAVVAPDAGPGAQWGVVGDGEVEEEALEVVVEAGVEKGVHGVVVLKRSGTGNNK